MAHFAELEARLTLVKGRYMTKDEQDSLNEDLWRNGVKEILTKQLIDMVNTDPI